jgi:SNF2 family DNA or RNA helicase
MLTMTQAHVIRNRSSLVYEVVSLLQGKHRWCLTGTPIQNRLEDLRSLVSFLRADPFDNLAKFQRVFSNPIKNGDEQGYECLRRLFQAISLRRTKAMLFADLSLPDKVEDTRWIELDPVERHAYTTIKRASTKLIKPGGSIPSALQVILRLRQVANHGLDLLPEELRQKIVQTSVGSDDVIDTHICEACNKGFLPKREDLSVALECLHQICKRCLSSTNRDNDEERQQCCPICFGDPKKIIKASAQEKTQAVVKMSYRPSSKVRALLEALDRDRIDAADDGTQVPKRQVVLASNSHSRGGI